MAPARRDFAPEWQPPKGDVAALSDGSFMFAWPDGNQDRVHVRRYIGSEMPKLPEVGDESPFPTVMDPNWVSVSGIDGRVVIVWSAVVDNVRQIQGQVLAY